MLIGNIDVILSAGNTFSLPEEWIKFLTPEIIITKGLEDNLYLFPQNEWLSFCTELNEKSILCKESRQISRFFFSTAQKQMIDRKGCLYLSDSHKNFIKAEKEMVLVGMGNRVEIWGKKAWLKYDTCADI